MNTKRSRYIDSQGNEISRSTYESLLAQFILYGCDVFLMAPPKNDNYKASDKNHLYLYKEGDNIFYEIEIISPNGNKRERHQLELGNIDLLQDLKNEAFDDKKYNRTRIYNAILDVTSKRGHTVLNSSYWIDIYKKLNKKILELIEYNQSFTFNAQLNNLGYSRDFLVRGVAEEKYSGEEYPNRYAFDVYKLLFDRDKLFSVTEIPPDSPLKSDSNFSEDKTYDNYMNKRSPSVRPDHLFFESYKIKLLSPDEKIRNIEKGELYFKIEGNYLVYQVKDPAGTNQSGKIDGALFNLDLSKPFSINDLEQLLPSILKITSERGHTFTGLERGRLPSNYFGRTHHAGILSDQATPIQLRNQFNYAVQHAKNMHRRNMESKNIQLMERYDHPFVASFSGTIGYNLLGLQALLGQELKPQEYKQFFMGMVANLVFEGHHSFHEVGAVIDALSKTREFKQSGLSIDSTLAETNPKAYYDQFLTEEFRQSEAYHEFSSRLHPAKYSAMTWEILKDFVFECSKNPPLQDNRKLYLKKIEDLCEKNKGKSGELDPSDLESLQSMLSDYLKSMKESKNEDATDVLFKKLCKKLGDSGLVLEGFTLYAQPRVKQFRRPFESSLPKLETKLNAADVEVASEVPADVKITSPDEKKLNIEELLSMKLKSYDNTQLNWAQDSPYRLVLTDIFSNSPEYLPDLFDFVLGKSFIWPIPLRNFIETCPNLHEIPLEYLPRLFRFAGETGKLIVKYAFLKVIEDGKIDKVTELIMGLAKSDKDDLTGWQYINEYAPSKTKNAILTAILSSFRNFKNEELEILGKNIRLALYNQNSPYRGLCKERDTWRKASFGKTKIWQTLLKEIQTILKERIKQHNLTDNADIKAIINEKTGRFF